MTISESDHTKLNQQKWDRWSRTFDNKWGAPFRYLQKRIVSLAELKSGGNFLDLGCGTGFAVHYAAELLKGQGNFVGIDISEGMIAKARENAAGIENIRFYRASSEELPLENDYFDAIICTNSFHHYLNPGKALAEVFRVLKPGGRIFILDGTTDDLITRWIDSLARKAEKAHVKQYSTAEYRQMFSDAGLHYLESRIVLFYPLKVHIARK